MATQVVRKEAGNRCRKGLESAIKSNAEKADFGLMGLLAG
jgi:hypothetical protein